MEQKRSCNNCMKWASGECSSLSGIVCEDYLKRQEIDRVEKESWPKYGDATAIRMQMGEDYDED